MSELTTQACIAGGGPAGMMLGYLLARAGVDVVVLEKHGDFLRDFRGDTVHPSTLAVMHEVGLLDEFLQRPHQKVERLAAQVGDEIIHAADFTRLTSASSASARTSRANSGPWPTSRICRRRASSSR
jgi:2-polyprenyl-6-methoxyphenol hydroxylase-like FAD-dependent oxidoreductase